MREKIIAMLRKNMGKPVSGEEISKQLSVSRTAVWKHIQQLKQAGYEIEPQYKKGYVLHSLPDLMLPVEIAAKLQTKWLGKNIIYKDSLRSTNDLAKQAALDDCPHGTIVVTEEQTGGRGRTNRGWFSPYGAGVWFSIVLRPPFLPHEAPKFTLFMAAVLAHAFKEYPGVAVDIKWPNDILCNGKKLVGILTEMSAQMESINYIVIGTGINIKVTQDLLPDDLKDKAGSLCDFATDSIDRVELLANVLKVFEDFYEDAVKNGFAHVLDEWRKHCITLGSDVMVIAPDESFAGQAKDIDEMGALLVKRKDGIMQKVLAGDVSVRAADGRGYV